MYIKNIVKVERLTPIGRLSGMRVLPQDFAVLPSGAVFTNVNIKIPAGCETTDKMDNGERIWTTKLTFLSCDDLDDATAVWRITTTDGRHYLVGKYGRPHPVMTRKINMPDSFTNSSLVEYTVTWKDVFKPLTLF